MDLWLGLGPWYLAQAPLRLAQGPELDVFHVWGRTVVKWHLDTVVPWRSDHFGLPWVALPLRAITLAWAVRGHSTLGFAPRADLVLSVAVGPMLLELFPVRPCLAAPPTFLWFGFRTLALGV